MRSDDNIHKMRARLAVQGDQDARRAVIDAPLDYMPFLLMELAANDRNYEMMEYESPAIKQLLVEIGKPALEALLAAVSANHRAARAAVKLLPRFNDPRIVPVLCAALTDPLCKVRPYIPLTLAQFKDERAVEPLISALSDRETYLQQESAHALGKMGALAAIEPLIDLMLAGGEPAITAVGALTKLGEPAWDAIRERAHHNDQLDALVQASQSSGVHHKVAFKLLVTSITNQNRPPRR